MRKIVGIIERLGDGHYVWKMQCSDGRRLTVKVHLPNGIDAMSFILAQFLVDYRKRGVNGNQDW